MGIMLALRENGELSLRLGQHCVPVHLPISVMPQPLSLPKDPSDWMRASMPALTGPHGSRPWVATLRSIAGLGALA